MNTAGGKDIGDLLRQTVEREEEERAPRDPSVRDVLAQLDRIEAMIGALNEQVGALNARMDELTKPVIYVGQTPPDTEAETQ